MEQDTGESLLTQQGHGGRGDVLVDEQEGNEDGEDILDDLPRFLEDLFGPFRVVNWNALSRRDGVVAKGLTVGSSSGCTGCRSGSWGVVLDLLDLSITYSNPVSGNKRSIEAQLCRLTERDNGSQALQGAR
jgi:hypothetical protein